MADALSAAFAARRPAFVAYLTAGFPKREATVPALLAMQEAGVDVIEVGVPFSDPLADGGTIQRANEVALRNGVTLADCLAMVTAARRGGLTVPVVLMGYYNPFLRYGEDALMADCVTAGINGFIVVDLPYDEAGSFLTKCRAAGRAFIPLVAPTTEPARLDKIAAVASGFVYCVSVTGVTGARTELPADLADFIARVRRHVTTAPLAVGFGISTREQAASVGALADGVVMGSAIIRQLESEGVEGLRSFLREVIPHAAPAGAAAASGGGAGATAAVAAAATGSA